MDRLAGRKGCFPNLSICLYFGESYKGNMSEYKRFRSYHVGFITEMITGLQVVDKPITDVNVEEARRVGLTILSRSTNPNKSLYRYNKCGHTEFLQPTHVRRNNFKCSTCQRIKEIENASKIGYTFLHKAGNAYRKYRRQCGHTIRATVRNVEISKAKKCQHCFMESLSESANRNGYELYKNFGNGKWLIKFKECGHEKEVHQTQIFKANCVCRECLLNEHIGIVTEQGLEFINQTSDRYSTYRLPCGHEKELRQDHAQDGAWLCSHCGDSHYSKPSNVYIIKFTTEDFSWLKFGFTRHVSLRANNYGLPSDTVKDVIDVIPFESGYEAMLFEKAIHSKYKHFRYQKGKMIEYHTFNGFTECYPVEMLETLMQELQNKRKQLSG